MIYLAPKQMQLDICRPVTRRHVPSDVGPLPLYSVTSYAKFSNQKSEDNLMLLQSRR